MYCSFRSTVPSQTLHVRGFVRLWSVPPVDRGVFLPVYPERAALLLRPVGVQDVMEDADHVRRESGDIPQFASREDASVVGIPVFMDQGEILSRDVLDVFGAGTVDLDESRTDVINREVVPSVPAVAAPVPDGVARGDCPLDSSPHPLEALFVPSHRRRVRP